MNRFGGAIGRGCVTGAFLLGALVAVAQAETVKGPAGTIDLGGYGEIHASLGEGPSPDLIDIHRLVFYVGYEFADWIRLHSETEVEHAFVNKNAGGEISIEQLHVDFLLSDKVNLRIGRLLTPLGIVNRKHEPPTFNGVERPSFAKYVIPSTWSSDGVGIFGSLTPSLRYEPVA
jgi:hypothetical protein